jgi:predicted transcriptional regulator of viral defense system
MIAEFVDACQRRGQYTFTDAELATQSPQTAVARRAALRRLHQRGRILRPLPRHGFFVIVPYEYHSMGAPPSAWYLDALMRYLGVPDYYLGLLTAAQWHGASHFAVQETQVIASKQLRPIHVGREQIRFFSKANASDTPVEVRMLENGPIRVSTPAATALDLVRYLNASGGLNMAAAGLRELSKKLKPSTLQEAIAAEPNPAVTQRLGYILERVAGARMTAPLSRRLAQQRPRPVPLDAQAPVKGAVLNVRWRLWINATIEPSP